jgi:hypothetical protein
MNQKKKRLFAADEQHNDGEDNTDDNACSQGEIEGKILAFVVEITGKPSDPRYFPRKQDEASYACDDEADDKEYLAETGKISHRVFPLDRVL